MFSSFHGTGALAFRTPVCWHLSVKWESSRLSVAFLGNRQNQLTGVETKRACAGMAKALSCTELLIRIGVYARPSVHTDSLFTLIRRLRREDCCDYGVYSGLLF